MFFKEISSKKFFKPLTWANADLLCRGLIVENLLKTDLLGFCENFVKSVNGIDFFLAGVV